MESTTKPPPPLQLPLQLPPPPQPPPPQQQQPLPASSSSSLLWTIGQQVVVQARTWAGINRPGGHGTITKLHYNDQGDVTAVDVKYTLGRSSDAHLGLHLVQPWVEPDRRERRRSTTTRQPQSQPLQQQQVPSIVAPRTTTESTDAVQPLLEKENAPNQKAGTGILRKPSLTGRRKAIADHLKKVKQHLVVTRKRGATNTTEAAAAAAATATAAAKSKAPTATPETKKTERSVDSSIPQEISFRVHAEGDKDDDDDNDDGSVVSDLEDDGVGIEDLPPERQYILPAEERHSTIGKRWSLFVGSIANHNGNNNNNIPAGSQTVNSGAPSRVSRPPVSVTKSLVSGHFSRTRHTTLASGAFERLPSKRKSPPSPTTIRPPLAHSKTKRKGAAAAAAAAATTSNTTVAADTTARNTTACPRRAAAAAAVPQPPPVHTEPGRGTATANRTFSKNSNNNNQNAPNLHTTTTINPNNASQKSLEQVFRQEQASATQFIQQVVSHAPASHPPVPPAAANTTAPSPPLSEETTSLRKQFFVALLNELLQNDDDMVEESTLLNSLNQLARKRAATFYPPSSSSPSKYAGSAGLPHHANFDTRSMEHFLAELSLENKIMRSDGQIYSI